MRTAINLWLIVLGVLGLYLAGAGSAVAAGASPWLVLAGVPLIYGAVFALVMTPYVIVAWLQRAPRPEGARIGVAATLRLLAGEYRALLVSVPRMMAYALLLRDPPPAKVAAPVLLVHGVLCNAGVWAGLARTLREAGIGPVYAISYDPPLASIDTFVPQLARRIDAILRATGASRLSIVAHSMGGLVTLAYCRRHGAAKLARMITLGTPFHGSMHAWMAPGLDMAQMRPGSAWLSALHAPGPGGLPPVVSIWSWHDTMVTPQTSSRLAGAREHVLVGVGHNALLGDRAARALVVAELARRDAPAEVPPARRPTSEFPA